MCNEEVLLNTLYVYCILPTVREEGKILLHPPPFPGITVKPHERLVTFSLPFFSCPPFALNRGMSGFYFCFSSKSPKLPEIWFVGSNSYSKSLPSLVYLEHSALVPSALMLTTSIPFSFPPRPPCIWYSVCTAGMPFSVGFCLRNLLCQVNLNFLFIG